MTKRSEKTQFQVRIWSNFSSRIYRSSFRADWFFVHQRVSNRVRSERSPLQLRHLQRNGSGNERHDLSWKKRKGHLSSDGYSWSRGRVGDAGMDFLLRGKLFNFCFFNYFAILEAFSREWLTKLVKINSRRIWVTIFTYYSKISFVNQIYWNNWERVSWCWSRY